MSVTLKPVAAAPRWEKQGNTIWVSCRACEGWFPIGGDLLANGTIELKCPHCNDAFLPPDAAKVIQP
ncbi:MAG: hypothetical protein H8E94_06745 [Alphaproteobacteria bacterium]|nr:hypothetical protein [Alphaproteobacteria bacterium]